MQHIVRRLIAGTLLSIGFFAGGTPYIKVVPKAEASFVEITDQALTLPFESKEMTAKDPFTSYIVAWQGPLDLHMHTRVKIDGEWTEWEEVYADADMNDPELSNKYFSQVQFTDKATHIQLQAESHEDTELQHLSIMTLGEKDKLELSFMHPQASALTDGFIVTRSEWGADTNYLYEAEWNVARDKVCKEQPWYCTSSPASEKAVAEKSKKVQEMYPEDTKIASTLKELDGHSLAWNISKSAKVNKLFVHHTANVNKDQNGDGKMTRADEEIAIRSIYYFHSVVRGWGDVGYNFIIGPSGTVYEGRAGGDFAVAAHAVWRNISSVGVSLMGNFEQETMGQNQKNALGNTLGYLAKKYSLDPVGNTTFYGKSTPTILGHKDSEEAATACPGKHVYNDLASIRTLANNAKNGAPGTVASNDELIKKPGFSASMSPLESAVVFEPLFEKTITLSVTNTGTETWDKNTYIMINSPKSGLFSVTSGDKTEKKAAVARDFIVPPGDTTAFDLKLFSGIQEFSGNITATVITGGKYQMESFAVPVQFKKGIVAYSDANITMHEKPYLFGAPMAFSISAKNTGSLPWSNQGEGRFYYEVLLQEPNGKITTLIPELAATQNFVQTGATATFTATIDTPFVSGKSQLILAARMKGYPELIGSPLRKAVDIVHPGDSGIFTVANDSTIMQNIVKMGTMADVKVRVKNSSNVVWENLTKYPLSVVLKNGLTYSVQDEAHFTSDKIAPGGEGEIIFPLLSGYLPGSQQLTATFNLSGKPIFNQDLTFSVNTPEEKLTASFLSTQLVIQENTSGQKLTIQAQNTGSITWKEGTVYLYPETADNIRWGFTNTVVGFSEKKNIAPGETATFVLDAPALSAGQYPANFGIRIQNGPTFTLSNPTISLQVKQAAKRFIPGNGYEFGTMLYQKTPVISSVTTASVPTTIVHTPVVISNPTAASVSKNIKVKLSYAETTARIKALESDYIFSTAEGAKASVKKGEEIMVSYTDGLITVKYGNTSWQTPKLSIVPSNANGRFQIVGWTRGTEPSTMNDNEFRGTLSLETVNNTLHYINTLPFNDYMKGLAEVPKSDPIEKQKAIILVARTYAYFYLDPKNRRDPKITAYDVSDDPDQYQRYRGYKYEERHTEWSAYLDATKDEIITYNGKLIKTPFFSESDGRTRSAEEVWKWTDTPYLVSKDDSSCLEGKGTLKGHGVGLSGCGSAGLARQGKSYKDIINYYYTGVQIKKIGEL